MRNVGDTLPNTLFAKHSHKKKKWHWIFHWLSHRDSPITIILFAQFFTIFILFQFFTGLIILFHFNELLF